MSLTIGSLFSGIGGLELGLERAGLGPVVWQVEKDEYCRAVLAKHWPNATRYEDVKDVGGANLVPVDVICGGFPCQDISGAGKRAGIRGERSGLWSEYVRVIRELRPRYVVVENVARLLADGMGVVLGDLAESGYDAEWDCLPAAGVGAPHLRDRVFIVAYPDRGDVWVESESIYGGGSASESRDDGSTRSLADTDASGRTGSRADEGESDAGSDRGDDPGWRGADVADSNREPARRDPEAIQARESQPRRSGERTLSNSALKRHDDGWRVECASGREEAQRSGTWLVEPDVGRVAHGVPARVDRLRALGNAVVPQVAEVVGQVVLSLEAMHQPASPTQSVVTELS